jgi:hypothetical protein
MTIRIYKIIDISLIAILLEVMPLLTLYLIIDIGCPLQTRFTPHAVPFLKICYNRNT